MKEETISIDNLKINYKIAGEGPAILILHGWGGSSDSWISVQEILSQNVFKVICPDLPGFGKSENPPIPWSNDDYCNFILDFIKEIKRSCGEFTEPFFLIGHSFGGGLAVKFTAKHPQKVKSLILSDAAIIRGKKRLSFRQRIAYLIAKIFNIPFFERIIFYPWFKKLVYKIAGTYDYYLAKGVMKETFKKTSKEDLAYFLSQIRVPTLIIWGKKDKTLPLEDGFLIRKEIFNSKIEIIEGADHSPHRKTPEELSKIILKFLEAKR